MSPEYNFPDSQTVLEQWYLALDLGTGLSACLLNRQTQKIYPIYWKTNSSSDGDLSIFRLPCEVWQETPNGLRRQLKNFKPYLNFAIPYIRITQDNASEVSQVPVPLLQLSDHQTVFLGKFQRALQLLLSTLTPPPQPQLKGLMLPHAYTCEAVGLDQKILHEMIKNLAGVIVSFPGNATSAYRFNVEKAILDVQLVKSPEQVLWLEEPIAIILAQLHHQVIAMAGGLLVINAGATTTEMALVELRDHMKDLQNSDFICHSWAYGGDALDLDIVCQLLLNSPTGKQLVSEVFSAQDFIFPQVGDADLKHRYRLIQQLQSQPLGVALLEAANALKRILPQQQHYKLEIEGYRWELNWTDLERLVLVPFIHQLNSELNHTLAQAGISSIGINQAICLGGNGVWQGLNRWLRQKLPNAVILPDAASESAKETDVLSLPIQTAMGLATLPLYPQVLDRPRHQYNDYFLLKELLNGFLERSLSLQQVMQVLESRGINTRSCYSRILAILKTQLPPGLIPKDPEWLLIHPASRQTPDYQRLSQGNLFTEEGGYYRLNTEQADLVRQYLKQLLSDYPQSLEEPAITPF